MAALRDIDDVAYVRFASVYLSFRDVNELMAELKQLVETRRAASDARPDASRGASAFAPPDERLMRRALALAERGRGTTRPNPVVGAVVVRGAGASLARRLPRAPASRTPRSHALRAARRPSAPRRDAVRDARALLPHRPHGAVHARPSGAPASRASSWAAAIRTRSSTGAASPRLRRAGVRVDVGCLRGRVPRAEPRPSRSGSRERRPAASR